ncbi:MAG: SAM-dependent methyltransferase [Proteobacteria bacterium]|nr:SAM-dependent methyltransferase [Pseudomonadota bacterium]
MSLAAALVARIRREGPISVADYIEACANAYYATGEVFGAGGDFITAPEISQTFGEIVGLWCAVTWQALGAPKTFRLIECGPGRGTLMADALRAASRVPGFVDAARIHLVERSPKLREKQRAALKGAGATWHDDIEDVPAGLAIVIANEFLDALPIRQWEKTERGWIERAVDVAPDGALRFTLGKARDLDIPLSTSADAAPGAIFETSPATLDWTRRLAARLTEHGGAALVIDYGHTKTALGDTLQAVKAHRYHSPLADPGEADITAHVDFEAVATAAREMGVKVFGPTPQGAWLTRLGITVRGAQLAAGKDEVKAKDIRGAVERLIAPDGMGLLFKVLAFTNPALEACEGFGEDASS